MKNINKRFLSKSTKKKNQMIHRTLQMKMADILNSFSKNKLCYLLSRTINSHNNGRK